MARGRLSLRPGEGISRSEFWSNHIAAFERSGVSMAQYCRDRGLSYACFQWWKRELKQRTTPLAFAEVVVAQPVPAQASAIEVVVNNGRTVRVHSGFDENALSRVLAVVERLGC